MEEPRSNGGLERLFQTSHDGGGVRPVRNHSPRGSVQKVLLLSQRGLHAIIQRFSRCRQEARRRHRTKHRGFAEGLQRNLSERANCPNGISKGRSHHLRLGCPCAGRGGNEFYGSDRSRASRRLHGVLQVYTTKTRDGENLK